MLKRYILFIVLSFLVFWFYALFFSPPQKRAPAGAAKKEEAGPPAAKKEEVAPPVPEKLEKGEEPSVEAPEKKEIEPIQPTEKPAVTWDQYEAEAKEENVALENEYCVITFTKYGGAIREILLKTSNGDSRVVIQGNDPVRIPPPNAQRLVKGIEEELRLNPLVITSRSPASSSDSQVKGGAGLDLSGYVFEVRENAKRKLVYELKLDKGLTVTKSFELAKDGYLLTVDISFENRSEGGLSLPAQELRVGTILPLVEKAVYKNIGFMVLGKERIHDTEELKKISAKPGKGKDVEPFAWVGWASVANKYFALILAPEEKSAKLGTSTVAVDDVIRQVKRTLSKDENDYFYSLGIGLKKLDLKQGEKVAHRYFFYAGPKEYDRLKQLNEKISGERQFEKVMSLGWFSFVGVPLLKILKWCYRVVPNFGLAIIFLTILIKVVLYPLDQKSYKSMKEMQKIQPLIAELKKKYKDDPRRAQVEQMKLFKEHKVNPLGGCLPMLLQMPVLIAMFGMLRSAVELWRAPFLLWINDLSEPDMLIDFHGELPLIGHLSLNILPLFLIATFVLQSKISKMGTSPAQQDPQQKAMSRMMTVFFGIIFYNMPSGLTLYFAVSTVLRVLQQYFVQKKD